MFESYRQGGLDSVLTEALFHALSGQVDLAGEPLHVSPSPSTDYS